MKHRRRVPRQPASWEGMCLVDGESPTWRRECRVIDISMLGLGMTFEHSSPSELLGRRIAIEVPAVGDSVSIRLEGVINNAVQTLEGAVRVGLAFDGLSESAPSTAVSRSTEKIDPTGAGVRPVRQ
jgi:PilZ domain